MADNHKRRIWWLMAWMVFEPLALFLAFLSAGAGHGDYMFCKLLFPIPMYIGTVQEEIGAISLILSLIQYPLVGMVPFLVSSPRAKYFYLLFAVSHVIFIGLVLMHPSTQFR